MRNVYAKMAQLFAEQGEVLVATELSPRCGQKYIGNDLRALGLPIDREQPFPQQQSSGEREFFVEQWSSPPELILAGGGHVSLAVAKIAKLLDFCLTVMDDRAEFANAERFPEADRVICGDIATGLRQRFGANAYYVIVTRGHKDDLRALEAVLAKPSYRYVGMIGSRAKVAFAMKQLREKGYKEEALLPVHAPIGLAIGAVTPAEIAVSIMAEIIQEMNRQGGDKNNVDLLTEISAAEEAMTLVTIIAKNGSSPRGGGSKMLVMKSGRIIGTIGGGAIEYEAARQAALLAGTGRAEIRSYDLSLQQASKLGMACGGTVKILLESVQ